MDIDRIICGDNVKVLQELPDVCIDLTVTSPPYDDLRTYNGYSWDFQGLAAELYSVTKQGGVLVWVVGDAVVDGSETGSSFTQALYFKSIGFKLFDTMIYEKSGNPPSPGRYTQEFEFMFVLSKGKVKTFNPIIDRKNKWGGEKTFGSTSRRSKDGSLKSSGVREINKIGKRSNIWRYSNGFGFGQSDKSAYEHPATFPETLARDHITSWSNPGDLILDPFVGSGTTAKMAKEASRHFIGIDISQEYCKLAEKRISGANVPLFT